MITVTYDDRSFMIDDHRVWITGGEFHYFRIPHELWEDRLVKARQGGLNCVTVPIAWRVHEPAEGEWNFAGGADIAECVQLAKDTGLYVIIRPGPFIGAECNFGGLPGWLTTKSGISYRTENAAFMHYLDKYFRQTLPQLAEFQITRGGNILLIQNENDYCVVEQSDRINYLDFISQLFQRAGFDIPVITANNLTSPRLDGVVETVTGWDDVCQDIRSLRRTAGRVPSFVSRFEIGTCDCWGDEHVQTAARTVARKAMEVLGSGAQLNYYLWQGGTNFGSMAGRCPRSPETWYTTGYDGEAPVSEGGGLTDKYYLLRPVNLFSSGMQHYLSEAGPEDVLVAADNSTQVLSLAGSNSKWAFVTNNGNDDIQTVRIALPSRKRLEVDLRWIGAVAVPYDMKLPDGGVMDYCTLQPIGFYGTGESGYFLVHGPPGATGHISIGGRERTVTVPADAAPVRLEHSGLTVIVVNSRLAERTWPLKEKIIFGPAFVSGADTICHDREETGYHVLPLDTGKCKSVKVSPDRSPRQAPPRLRKWERCGACPEPVASDLAWKDIDGPHSMDKLDADGSYVWYRLELQVARARKRRLFFPECADRAGIFLNGKYVGTWGAGDGASRRPMQVNLKKGTNILVVLAENLGRFSAGDRLGEEKGLFGQVYDARPLRTNKFKLSRADSFPRRVIPRHLGYLMERLESTPLWIAELAISLKELCPVYVSFQDIPHHLGVVCNDRPLDFFAVDDGDNFGSFLLGQNLKKGKNNLRLLLWGDVEESVLSNLAFYRLQETVSDSAAWSWRPFTGPGDAVGTSAQNLPGWFASSFNYPAEKHDSPLFLAIDGACKGRIYVNGRDLGRYWNTGPQKYYYVPGCWLERKNRLLLFEESGKAPKNTKLHSLPEGPAGA